MLSFAALTPLLLSLSATLTLTLAAPAPAPAPPAIEKRATGVVIYSSRRPNFCLGTTFIRGARPGITVDLIDCSSSYVLQWDINRGAGFVTVTGGGLVLDTATSPGNFGYLITETPANGKASQNWYYTDDDRIAITGGDQCLDDDGSRLQTYRCTTGNTNQIFRTRGGSDGGGGQPQPNPEPPAPTPFDPLPSIPRGTVYPDSSPSRRRIHPLNRGDLCVTILGNSFRAGNDVGIAYCVPESDQSAKYQFFNPQGTFARVAGPLIAADNTNYCISAQASNGVGASLQPCGGTASTFRWDNPTSTFRLGQDQLFCLDIRSESTPGNQSPLRSERNIQTWQCYEGNTNQQWTFLY